MGLEPAENHGFGFGMGMVKGIFARSSKFAHFETYLKSETVSGVERLTRSSLKGVSNRALCL